MWLYKMCKDVWSFGVCVCVYVRVDFLGFESKTFWIHNPKRVFEKDVLPPPH